MNGSFFDLLALITLRSELGKAIGFLESRYRMIGVVTYLGGMAVLAGFQGSPRCLSTRRVAELSKK
jgi:hypothetical protein